MNIIQLEDDIKSLPDDRLITEMQNPTGGFPQYLLMSEIKRRKEMRDDYQGRMAAYEKTPPRPSMAEETISEGISSIMPSNIPQGEIPNGMPMGGGMPVNQPASIQGGGLESLMPQNMASGGRTNRVMLGKTNYQSDTNPYDYLGNLSNLNIDPTGLGFLSDREKELEQELIDYYSPEKTRERNKFRKGMNLVQAGLAVGTSRTPEDVSKNVGTVIQGAIKGQTDAERERIAGIGAQAKFSGLERERQFKVADLALKADYNKAIIKQTEKPDEITKLATSLATQLPGRFGGERLPDIDKKTGKVILDANNKYTYIQGRRSKFNFEAYKSASKSLKTMGAYQRSVDSESEHVTEALASPAFQIDIIQQANKAGLQEGTPERVAFEDKLRKEESIRASLEYKQLSGRSLELD